MIQKIPSFDTLLMLAEHDPKQLEKIRRHLSERIIDSAPEYLRPRLRGLQFRIDATRRRAKNPLDACIQLSGMMFESLEELRAALNGTPVHRAGNRRCAQILPFQHRQTASRRQTS